ncbi:MAG TPA: PA2778 family cysteine peptidase [Ramlibacter sp.]|uniref:PA2778 family cysteine peptidase n=1 Tax=Ramlibacter sp. TaxID=1917967 RepID=UPI002C428559|nr:PA2778 family cysteine peptidase [Ramlibacter sp.]HVZ46205.1 PA2778 family cysteine peptidase [Ramlibacter sp.]
MTGRRSAVTRRSIRRLCCGLLLSIAVSGCAILAPLVPQTVALRTSWPQGVPERTELASVPFFPQDEYQCGPAALATVLGASGAAVTPESLVPEVWLPSRKGSLQLEMLAAPRKHGRVSYRLEPNYSALLREVAAGNPVIVLQDVGPLFAWWHYAVVNGYDYGTGTIYLRSGTEPRKEMPFTAFERTWIKSGYWAMVVLPPDRVAASAEEDSWLESLLAFGRVADTDAVRRAYAAMLRRWPDSLAAAIGLANALHTQGSLAEAADVLRRALERHPQSVIAMNNLAQTLSDQGLQQQALEQIDRAMDAQSPFASDVRATRELILQRIQLRLQQHAQQRKAASSSR